MGCTASVCMPSFAPPPSQIQFTVDDVCKIAKTGDIILFSGTSTNSKIIEFICPSVWSHVGIVIEDPQRKNEPLIFESVESPGDTYAAYPPYTIRSGVRTVRLKDYLKNYKGNSLAIRTLQCRKEYIPQLRAHMMRTLVKQIKEHNNKPYEKRWFEFVNARYRIISSPKNTLDSFFCSELVAWVYMEAGLLQDFNCNSPSVYLPDDFGDTGEVQLCTPQDLAGANIKLSEEKYIQCVYYTYCKQQQSNQNCLCN